MGLFHFHIDVDVPPEVVAERIRAAVGNAPTLWNSLTWSRDAAGRPFLGTVTGDSFRISRDVSSGSYRYRNPFLPVVWGRLRSTPTGTRVNVTIFIRPIVAMILMVFILYFVGVHESAALRVAVGVHDPAALSALWVAAVMLAIVVAAFLPEAFIARRLIFAAVQRGHDQSSFTHNGL